MSTYNVKINDDTGNLFTATIIRGGTPASGGTAVALPAPDNATTDFDSAVAAAVRRIKNDRADGN